MTRPPTDLPIGEVAAMFDMCVLYRDFGPLDYVTCTCGFNSIILTLTGCPHCGRVLGERSVMIERP